MPDTLGLHVNNKPGWNSIYDELAVVVEIHVRRLEQAERCILPSGKCWREDRVELYLSADKQRLYAVDRATLAVLQTQLLDMHQGGGGSLGAMRSDPVGDYRWFGAQRYEALGLDLTKRLGDFGAMTQAARQQLNAQGFVLSNLARFNIGYFKHQATGGPVGRTPDVDNKTYKNGLDRERQKGGHGSPGVMPGAGAAVRLNAATVMGGSATNYAQATLQQNAPTAFEWCHLIGHGDGGAEHPNNFVAGTHYANTNQLAIEIARRARGNNFRLKVTAYVDPHTRLARYIRYKIYAGQVQQPGEAALFDHVFDATSHGFDYNEFKLLKTVVTEALV